MAAVVVALAGCGQTSTPTKRATTTTHAKGTTSSTRAEVTRPPAAPAKSIGSFRVGTLTLTLSEPASAAAGTATTSTAQPMRPLPTLVRYPATGPPDANEHSGAPAATSEGPFPLVVFSQGFDTATAAYGPMLDALASAGFVVAAPTYPDTDPSAGAELNEADLVHHPADLRFVIASLLSRPAAIPAGLLDSHAVALVGQSDGGDLSLAGAYNTCCSDAAVKAAAILSGAEWASFGGAYFRSGAVPLLVVQGSADTINVPGCSAQLYDQAPQPKYYLDLLGAEHLPPYVEPGPYQATVERTTVDFLNGYLKHSRASVDSLLRDGNAPGTASITTAATLTGAARSCPGAP